jgi:hypothetical protein
MEREQASYAVTENSLFVRCSAPFSVAAGFIPAIRDPVPTGAGELRRYGKLVVRVLASSCALRSTQRMEAGLND